MLYFSCLYPDFNGSLFSNEITIDLDWEEWEWSQNLNWIFPLTKDLGGNSAFAMPVGWPGPALALPQVSAALAQG